MEQQYGEKTTKALDFARLPTSGRLTQPQAEHILSLVYPNCPKDEIIRCAILCRDFGLHPLMKEVYLIPFKDRSGKENYTTVIGIAASRKMAADKKGAYSFIDDSPRAATHKEIVKQYGEDSEEEKNNLISICKVQGEKGNEAIGFGLWPKGKEPYGTDKGNTKRNMANIRSERQGIDRLPGEALPLRDIEVIDGAFVEVPQIGKVSKATGEITEEKAEEPELETETIIEEEPEQEPQSKAKTESRVDISWLIESVNTLKWDILKHIKETYQVETTGNLGDVVSRLSEGQQDELCKELQARLDLK